MQQSVGLPASSSDDLSSSNTHAVDDVDVAVEGREVRSEDSSMSHAEALDRKTLPSRTTKDGHLLHMCAHTYPVALANFPNCGGVHGP